MTRDEAIECYGKTNWPDAYDKTRSALEAGRAIDCYVALGMLKLDEPKPIKLRFCDACVGIGGMATQQIWENLHAAGLKIVEK